MLRIKPLLVLCAALLTVTPAASADVNSDMNQFFNKLGFASNTTQPGVWQGQAAGYAYGGSLYARTQVKNIQLISMTLPDINAGCGGIDAYLGSFSFINGDQLQRFVKQIMSNAAGYFFDLALQATVPEIKTAKDFLQKMASDINSMNLSSCQVAQGIVGGLFPQTQVSNRRSVRTLPVRAIFLLTGPRPVRAARSEDSHRLFVTRPVTKIRNGC